MLQTFAAATVIAVAAPASFVTLAADGSRRLLKGWAWLTGASDTRPRKYQGRHWDATTEGEPLTVWWILNRDDQTAQAAKVLADLGIPGWA